MPPRFTPRTLAQWPWVVVRVDCPFCRRCGRYRLARLAAKYGPEQSIDGLLRDLCQDCPWFNDRPRKYEPRCGARLTDREHAFPPADHPDEPGGAPALSNWPDKEIVMACKVCGRREVYAVADLRTMYGADMLLTNLRPALAMACPRQAATSIYEQCGALLFRAGEA